MDQASRIIARWADASDVISREKLACAAWKKAVGKRLANRTRPSKLVRSTLVVEVEDEMWRRNLWGFRYQIVRNLQSALGPDIVTDVEFRVVPLRREPQRESGKTPEKAPSLDEADAIADPGLRRIYRAARDREIA